MRETWYGEVRFYREVPTNDVYDPEYGLLAMTVPTYGDDPTDSIVEYQPGLMILVNYARSYVQIPNPPWVLV